MFRIRFHGRGGQGMKTASRILGSAAFHAGYTVQDAPLYGAERRGAPMAAFTRIASVAVIDQNLAAGLGGITYQEIAAALYTSPSRPPLLSVIGGLGGKDISEAEFDAVFRDLERAAAGLQVSSPRLLYTQPEQARMRTLLQIAGKALPEEVVS
ncbi:MAG: hypothetical protein FJZ47_23385 [Candidatus Tectomicrobia bacterium]|uniref:Pyruvate/ketoisovalerate oxidoreductase catalytic domain-containing protein n=1 Tax=Tectimicrobiota bacterium TaxID=2528274 RepID=A0A937W5T5_UNCTE|nr:hypothetical protein [Candidatus Tectomicrobia bacterium]